MLGLEDVSLWSEWRTVNSKNLAATRYNAGLKKLHIVFNNGRQYEYDDVDPSTYENMLNSYSPGKFFYNAVRKFDYTYREL